MFDSYKRLISEFKSLIDDDLILLAQNGSVISEIADKYKHELVMQVAYDRNRASTKLELLNQIANASKEYDYLNARWRRELIDFVEMNFT